jgi:hypothetical protein
MADFALLFNAPDRAWAEHVERLIQPESGMLELITAQLVD